MKRTRTIVADDGGTKVSVVVKIEDRGGLTRGEVNTMSDIIASGVMIQLAATSYLSVYLSDIRVK